MLARRRESIVGLDIGSHSVKVVVAELRAGEPVVVGLGQARNTGLRKGVVVDIESTARAIEGAVERAARMSGHEITRGLIGVSGSHIGCINNRGVVAVAHPDREISEEDVRRVLEAARVVHLPPDREIVHLIAREFEVDGYDGVRDPVGMVGSRLEVEAHMVTAASASLQNLVRATERAGVDVQEVMLAGLASAEAVLTPAEKELGVVLCDVGGGTTDIAVFDRGSLFYTAVIPLGGEHITSDIAVGLRTPLPTAEQVKEEYGHCMVEQCEDATVFDLPNPSGKGSRQVTQRLLASIIEPRVQEIFAHVAEEIRRSGYGGVLPGGVVFTGGSSMLRGFIDLASDQLDLPVRVGAPIGLGGMSEMVASPRFATAVGMVLRGAGQGRRGQAEISDSDAALGVWSRLKNFFSDLF